MFKQPAKTPVPVIEKSLMQDGPLAIRAGRSANPPFSRVDISGRNYFYRPPPVTILSNTASRFRRIYASMQSLSTNRSRSDTHLSTLANLPRAESRRASISRAGASSEESGFTNSLELCSMRTDNRKHHESGRVPTDCDFVLAPPVIARRFIAQTNPHDLISIIDSGCDFNVLGLGWVVIKDYGELVYCNGAFFLGDDDVACRLVSALTVFHFPNSELPPVLVQANHALLNDDPNQVESLLSPCQMMHFGVRIDMVPSHLFGRNGDPGTQGMTVSNVDIPFTFDGLKMYIHHRLPTENEIQTMSRLVLTSDKQWRPWCDLMAAVRSRRTLSSIKIVRRRKVDNAVIERWQRNMGFAPRSVILKTLANTTQLAQSVSSDSRDVPQKHLAARLLQLRHRRLRETFSTDWFHSDIVSTRWNKGMQVYYGRRSHAIFPYCRPRKFHFLETLQELFCDVGLPAKLVLDGDGVQCSTAVKDFLRKHVIPYHNSEPEYQNQNPSERAGGIIKHHVKRIHFHTEFDLSYWDYCVENVCDYHNHLANSQNGNRPPLEVLNGVTVDISVFRFYFWQRVWYWDPHIKWPHHQWCKGHHLGRCFNVGDPFTFWILPDQMEKYIRKPRPIARSVVRPLSDENEIPPGVNDMVDFPVPDILYPDGDVSKVALPMILEEGPENMSMQEDCSIDSSDPNENNEVDDDLDDAMLAETHEVSRVESSPDDEQFFDELERDLESAVHGDIPPIRVSTPGSVTPGESSTPHQSIPSVTQDEDEDNIPLDDAGVEAVTDQYARLLQADGSPCDINAVAAHRRSPDNNRLELEVEWCSGEKTWAPFTKVKKDDPKLVAQYVLANADLSQHSRWARSTLRTLRRTVRRLQTAFRCPRSPSDALSWDRWQQLPPYARRRHSTEQPAIPKVSLNPSDPQSSNNSTNQPKKKRRKTKAGRNNRHMGEVKYGVRVPNNYKEAIRLDKENGNTLWAEATAKEMFSLKKLACFRVAPDGFRPKQDGYQYAPLRLIFDVKSSLKQKARLVCGGHVLKTDLNTYASTVKTLSIRLIHLIAAANELEVLCGDVSCAFVNAFTNEKVWTRAGPEFGPALEGKPLVIVKALYGMKTSAERWRAHFAATLRSFGFESSRADSDVWLRARENKSGYDYICTHVDDFTIAAKDPAHWMSLIESNYSVKDIGPPKYYLGNDYITDSDGSRYIGSSTYVCEALRKIESRFGVLSKERTPAPPSDHPEQDTSALCSPDEHKNFQGLIGTAQWIVLLGRMDIAQAISSLSRFSAAPRSGHLDRAWRIFGYLKRHKHKAIRIDPRPPLFLIVKEI